MSNRINTVEPTVKRIVVQEQTVKRIDLQVVAEALGGTLCAEKVERAGGPLSRLPHRACPASSYILK
jgi:hypothetical protein